MSVTNEEICETETVIKISYMAIPGMNLDGYKFIKELVCSEFDIDKDKVFERSRKRKYVFARQLMMYLAYNSMSSQTLKKIGDAYGGYDHATVLHAKTSIENYLFSDKHLYKKITRLTEDVRMVRKRFIQERKRSL